MQEHLKRAELVGLLNFKTSFIGLKESKLQSKYVSLSMFQEIISND